MRLPIPAAVLVALATATSVLAVPRAGDAAPNPCTLVTTAEATAAMGATSLPGKPHTSKQSSSCRFYSTDHTKNVFVQTADAGDMQGSKQFGDRKSVV